MQFYALNKTLSIWIKFQNIGSFPPKLGNNPISNYYGEIFDHILKADERYLVMQIPPRQCLYLGGSIGGPTLKTGRELVQCG